MNKVLLEEEMKNQGISKQKMCSILGLSRSAFYRKCNGISEFTQGEIQEMVDILNLTSPMGIFLTKKCLKRNL